MLDELLDSLLFMRGIQHWIDFLVRASLPNLSCYKLSPKNREIFGVKVKELLNKR